MCLEQYYNQKAVEVLERALKTVMALKATPHNNHLIVVLLDGLEDDLNKLRTLKKMPEYPMLLKTEKVQNKLGIMFARLIRFIVEFFNIIPLSCTTISGWTDFIYMKIGTILKNIRRSKRIKQKDLAAKLGISNAYLSSIENNKREPSMDLAKMLSNELGIPLGYFLIKAYNENFLTGKQKKIFIKTRKLIDEFLELQAKNDTKK